jgi:hypothetical protein
MLRTRLGIRWAGTTIINEGVKMKKVSLFLLFFVLSLSTIAADGTGRNGLFTSQLLKNLTTPGLEVRISGFRCRQTRDREQTLYYSFFDY